MFNLVFYFNIFVIERFFSNLENNYNFKWNISEDILVYVQQVNFIKESRKVRNGENRLMLDCGLQRLYYYLYLCSIIVIRNLTLISIYLFPFYRNSKIQNKFFNIVREKHAFKTSFATFLKSSFHSFEPLFLLYTVYLRCFSIIH